MCTTGMIVIDNVCQLGLRTGGIGYLFALALVLFVLASAFLAWKKVQRLIAPYRNEMRMTEFLLFCRYYHYLPDKLKTALREEFGVEPPEVRIPATEIAGMWQAIGHGTLSRAIIAAAILIPLLLIAR